MMKFIILLFVMINILNAEPREALLIGNYEYDYMSNLNNPINNLKRLKRSLESIDFNVDIKLNLKDSKLAEAIDDFKNRLAQDRNTIGFLYYTGHGCQVDYQGYLIPTNIDTTKKVDIKYNAMNINKLLEILKEANNKVNMLFLDACRNIPTGTKGGTKGLAQPTQKPIGTLLVYATEAGKVANDNSKFINALIENINKPNQYLRDIADNISNSVAQKTSYTQIPEVFSKLLPKMILKGRGGHSGGDGDNHPMKGITKLNGLMYQNQPFTKKYTWKEAKEYCQNLTLGGYSDWRLPTRAELMKLGNIKLYNYDNYDNWKKWFNKNKHRRYKNSKNHYYFIKKEFIENMPEFSWFWTSTEEGSSYAWNVCFKCGSDGWDFKTYKSYALCVRGQ